MSAILFTLAMLTGALAVLFLFGAARTAMDDARTLATVSAALSLLALLLQD
jgi:hypothetical protein